MNTEAQIFKQNNNNARGSCSIIIIIINEWSLNLNKLFIENILK